MITPKPWLVENSPWKTEASFWAWVRGVLRKGWSKHPVRILYMHSVRKKVINPSKKSNTRFPEIWGYTCEICKQTFKQQEIEVDHKSMAGKFTCLDDVKDYVKRLFMVDFNCLRVLCKPCHKIVSYSQTQNMTFEEARIEKQIIAIMKLPKKELVAFLKKHGYNSLPNEKQRRDAVKKILSG